MNRKTLNPNIPFVTPSIVKSAKVTTKPHSFSFKLDHNLRRKEATNDDAIIVFDFYHVK